jgi:uncharacterized protein (DUF1499 family)
MRYAIIRIALPCALMALLSTVSCSVPKLGLKNGRLVPCPTSPNCVSSLAPPSDSTHHVEPLVMHKSLESTLGGIKAVLASMPRTLILSESSDYLRAQCTTLIFRFKDDVEFHILPSKQLVHIRSGSRIGHSDFGTNRQRVETIRSAWDAWRSRQ